MSRVRSAARRHCRRLLRRHWRPLTRSHMHSLPGCERGSDYLTQAIGAFRRAIRAHRRLARLAPGIFDSVVVERERRQREQRRRWMASWETVIEKCYGPASPSGRHAEQAADHRPKLHPRTERAMHRELANWNFWFASASWALKRHRQRRPHALISFNQMASLLDIAFKLKQLACGLDSTQPLPEPLRDNKQWEADLARSYGQPRAAPAP